MSFDEMLKEAQKKYGACLYGRSHMLRSLDRLVAVGDLCIVRNGGSLILKITQTGKERFSKKVSDYEHSGMIMKWGRIGRIINKYCLYDMAVAILKVIYSSNLDGFNQQLIHSTTIVKIKRRGDN